MGGDIMQLIPFVHAFYAFESPFFCNHCNCEGDVIIIPSAIGTRQGDPLGGALFTLTHFRALRSIIIHSYLFPFIVDDIHIINTFSLYPMHMNIFILNFMRYVFLSNLKSV
jgi:hypothetical protein